MKNAAVLLLTSLGASDFHSSVAAPLQNPAARNAQTAPQSRSKTTIRIVDCDEKVQSRKRGVGASALTAADFKILSQGVSWYYNWHFEPGDAGTPPGGTPMQFIPMVWGDRAESLSGLQKYLAAGNKPRSVLGINEPNLSEQAFMSPEKAADLFGRIKAITDKYKIPLSGPQMSIGSPPEMSIKTFDPVENKELTYTFMVPYLKAFFHYAAKSKIDVASIGIHPYMNQWGLMGITDMAYKEFKRPIWVTEFNVSDESISMKETRVYLIQATDFMERYPYVEGYAFFKERVSGRPKISLLAEEPGKLTPLGEAYINMPVHDANLYYRIPGRLQAENYVALDKMQIWPTQDVDGFTHMASNEANASLDYNLHVSKAGKHNVRFRVTGQSGRIDILKGNRVLASVNANPDADKWETVQTVVDLPSGSQTIRIRCEASGQSINWIGFARTS
jgi:hypothetical protein